MAETSSSGLIPPPTSHWDISHLQIYRHHEEHSTGLDGGKKKGSHTGGGKRSGDTGGSSSPLVGPDFQSTLSKAVTQFQTLTNDEEVRVCEDITKSALKLSRTKVMASQGTTAVPPFEDKAFLEAPYSSFFLDSGEAILTERSKEISAYRKAVVDPVMMQFHSLVCVEKKFDFKNSNSSPGGVGGGSSSFPPPSGWAKVSETSFLSAKDRVLVHVWESPKAATRFKRLWKRVWNGIFESGLRERVKAPLSFLGQVQGTSISVTCIPQINSDSSPLNLPSATTKSFSSYLSRHFIRAVHLEATATNSAPVVALYPSAHGNEVFYLLNIRPLLIHRLSKFPAVLARTEFLDVEEEENRKASSSSANRLPVGESPTFLDDTVRSRVVSPAPSSRPISAQSYRGGSVSPKSNHRPDSASSMASTSNVPQTITTGGGDSPPFYSLSGATPRGSKSSTAVKRKDSIGAGSSTSTTAEAIPLLDEDKQRKENIPAAVAELLDYERVSPSKSVGEAIRYWVQKEHLKTLLHNHGVNLCLLFVVRNEVKKQAKVFSHNSTVVKAADTLVEVLHTEMALRTFKTLVRVEVALCPSPAVLKEAAAEQAAFGGGMESSTLGASSSNNNKLPNPLSRTASIAALSASTSGQQLILASGAGGRGGKVGLLDTDELALQSASEIRVETCNLVVRLISRMDKDFWSKVIIPALQLKYRTPPSFVPGAEILPPQLAATLISNHFGCSFNERVGRFTGFVETPGRVKVLGAELSPMVQECISEQMIGIAQREASTVEQQQKGGTGAEEEDRSVYLPVLQKWKEALSPRITRQHHHHYHPTRAIVTSLLTNVGRHMAKEYLKQLDQAAKAVPKEAHDNSLTSEDLQIRYARILFHPLLKEMSLISKSGAEGGLGDPTLNITFLELSNLDTEWQDGRQALVEVYRRQSADLYRDFKYQTAALIKELEERFLTAARECEELESEARKEVNDDQLGQHLRLDQFFTHGVLQIQKVTLGRKQIESAESKARTTIVVEERRLRSSVFNHHRLQRLQLEELEEVKRAMIEEEEKEVAFSELHTFHQGLLADSGMFDRLLSEMEGDHEFVSSITWFHQCIDALASIQQPFYEFILVKEESEAFERIMDQYGQLLLESLEEEGRNELVSKKRYELQFEISEPHLRQALEMSATSEALRLQFEAHHLLLGLDEVGVRLNLARQEVKEFQSKIEHAALRSCVEFHETETRREITTEQHELHIGVLPAFELECDEINERENLSRAFTQAMSETSNFYQLHLVEVEEKVVRRANNFTQDHNFVAQLSEEFHRRSLLHEAALVSQGHLTLYEELFRFVTTSIEGQGFIRYMQEPFSRSELKSEEESSRVQIMLLSLVEYEALLRHDITIQEQIDFSTDMMEELHRKSIEEEELKGVRDNLYLMASETSICGSEDRGRQVILHLWSGSFSWDCAEMIVSESEPIFRKTCVESHEELERDVLLMLAKEPIIRLDVENEEGEAREEIHEKQLLALVQRQVDGIEATEKQVRVELKEEFYVATAELVQFLCEDYDHSELFGEEGQERRQIRNHEEVVRQTHEFQLLDFLKTLPGAEKVEFNRVRATDEDSPSDALLIYEDMSPSRPTSAGSAARHLIPRPTSAISRAKAQKQGSRPNSGVLRRPTSADAVRHGIRLRQLLDHELSEFTNLVLEEDEEREKIQTFILAQLAAVATQTMTKTEIFLVREEQHRLSWEQLEGAAWTQLSEKAQTDLGTLLEVRRRREQKRTYVKEQRAYGREKREAQEQRNMEKEMRFSEQQEYVRSEADRLFLQIRQEFDSLQWPAYCTGIEIYKSMQQSEVEDLKRRMALTFSLISGQIEQEIEIEQSERSGIVNREGKERDLLHRNYLSQSLLQKQRDTNRMRARNRLIENEALYREVLWESRDSDMIDITSSSFFSQFESEARSIMEAEEERIWKGELLGYHENFKGVFSRSNFIKKKMVDLHQQQSRKRKQVEWLEEDCRKQLLNLFSSSKLKSLLGGPLVASTSSTIGLAGLVSPPRTLTGKPFTTPTTTSSHLFPQGSNPTTKGEISFLGGKRRTAKLPELTHTPREAAADTKPVSASQLY